MLRFYTGDDLGNIKSIECTIAQSEDGSSSEWKFAETALQNSSSADRSLGVQKLAISQSSDKTLLAAARCSGFIASFNVNDEGGLDVLEEWKDPRFKAGHSFVGLEYDSNSSLLWCTSNGALSRKSVDPESSATKIDKATLPIRLRSWKLSPSSDTFAYGGNEVDLSIWDVERAFSTPVTDASADVQSTSNGKKRKRGNDLLPAEVWRAKNLPNDALSLRQPVNITSLTYLKNTSPNSNHLATGTETGDVRRYDTRAAKRPVANWKGVAKVGGVKTVQAGLHEHELFVSDCGTNLFALDLRTGRVAYSYKRLSGAVNCAVPVASSSPTSSFLASTSHDRFFRLHSTFAPPKSENSHQEQRGEVLGSVYMKSTPTAVVYDARLSVVTDDAVESKEGVDDEEGDEDVWAGMQEVDSEEEDDGKRRRKANRKKQDS